MPFSKPKPEKPPEQEELRKEKRIPKGSKRKCLACKDGMVYDNKKFRQCTACKGWGYIT
jgi:hypothetical protein